MVTHSNIVDPLYILHENMQILDLIFKYLTFNFLNILENTYLITF
jgi:hypothetical protein